MDQPPPHRLSARGRRWFDITLASGLLLVVPITSVGLGLDAALLAVVQLVPLYWRRSHPVTVFAVVYAMHALQVLVTDTPLPSQLAFPIALYSVTRQRGLSWNLPALGLSLLAALVAAIDWNGGSSEPLELVVSNAFGIALIVVVAWVLAQLGRTREAYVNSLIERSERVAREADQRAELAAQSERNRIAREMHDVVAHGLSVIIVQADGARYASVNRPAAAVEALDAIAATGREALTEMRSLLGLLRDGGTGTAPQPDLGDLPALLDEARASLQIDAHLDTGLDDVPAGVALTAYRLIQEALTNVRKHAGPDVRVSVGVRREEQALRLWVRDDGRGASAHDDGAGHGLLGMRERITAHGGELSAGPQVGGGYAVDARIPW